MAEMFKKQGYITGIVGKSQPIYDKFEADDLTQENWNHIMQKTSNYNKALGGGTGERIVFWQKYILSFWFSHDISAL